MVQECEKIRKLTAEEEYSKDPKLRKEDISQLQGWLLKQPHLPELEEFELIQYYHSSDYSLQKAKDLIETHYTFRNEALEFYPTADYKQPQYSYDIWKVCYILQCPAETPEGYRIIYCGMRDPDPSKYNFEIASAALIRMMTTIVGSQGICPGYVCIFDLENICVQHLATVTVSLVRKFLYFVQDAVPIRMKAVHLIHITPLLEKIMFLIRPFIKKALMDLLHFDSDINDLYAAVPKHCLPSDLGGTLPVTRAELTDLIKRRLDEAHDFMEENMQKRVDETKRIGGARKTECMEGSFKKIELD